MNLQSLVRSNIWNLTPYSSARDEFKGKADVFLDANENPFNTGLNRYPDPLQWQLKRKIAGIKNIPAEQIFLGNGSDEVIDLLFRIFCEPQQDHIIILPPTYGMYQVSADIAAVQVKKIPLTSSFQPNVSAIREAAGEHSKILFLCSPNNPTGNAIDQEMILEILQFFPGIVAVDEAYIDFSGKPGCMSLLSGHPNLVVFQTFSKAWGLAALRLGMAFASPEIIGFFNKVKAPYNLNQLTQEMALSLLDQLDQTQQMVTTILSQRALLAAALPNIPYVQKVYPSDANFLLVKMDQPNEVYKQLVEQGIIVRNRSNVVLCEGCLRITVGTEQENRRLLEAMERQNL